MGSDKKVDNSLLFLSGSALTAEVIKCQPHPSRASTHNAMSNYGRCG